MNRFDDIRHDLDYMRSSSRALLVNLRKLEELDNPTPAKPTTASVPLQGSTKANPSSLDTFTPLSPPSWHLRTRRTIPNLRSEWAWDAESCVIFSHFFPLAAKTYLKGNDFEARAEIASDGCHVECSCAHSCIDPMPFAIQYVG
jgi:hypothetical protein